MHPVVFGVKRAYWAATRWGIRCLKEPRIKERFGEAITPARFEYLYLLRQRSVADDGSIGAMLQSVLCGILDVASVTVSRMLRVLEKLGLVERGSRACADRRTRWVSLTEAGLACVDEILGSQVVHRYFDRQLVLGLYDSSDYWESWRDWADGRAGRRLRAFHATLRRVAVAVRDNSRVWDLGEDLEVAENYERAPEELVRDWTRYAAKWRAITGGVRRKPRDGDGPRARVEGDVRRDRVERDAPARSG
jgi:DNA-binding MarR family transcriptional regulator